MVRTVERVLGARVASTLTRALLVARPLLVVGTHLLYFVLGCVVIFFMGWLIALTAIAIRPDLQDVVNENASYFIYAAMGLWGLWQLIETVRELRWGVRHDPIRAIPSASKWIIPLSIKYVVYYREEGRCRRCAKASGLGYDHIVPMERGGRNEANNIELLCGSCIAKPKAYRYVYPENRRLSSSRARKR